MPKPKSKQDKPKPTTAKDFEELGRRLNNIYQMGYVSRLEMMKMGFLKGIAAGVGGVIGATIVVTLLVWILSLLGRVPIIDDAADTLKNSVETRQTR